MSDDVKWPIVSTGSRLDCSCGERQRLVADLEKSRALVQQLDRTNESLYASLKELRAAAEQAREALESLRDEHGSVGENEEGEEYVTCERCDGSGWGGDKDGIEHRGDCPFKALAALDAVLKEK